MSELESKAKSLVLLGQLLMEAAKAKSAADRVKILDRAKRAVDEFKWDDLRNQILNDSKVAEDETSKLLNNRRENLHQAARDRNFYRQRGESDSIDIFKIKFKTEKVVIEFAGAEIEQLEELDGRKLLDHLCALKSRLEKSAYDREKFFRQLECAIRAAGARDNPRDGFVPIPLVWREIVFEHAWAKAAFARSGLAKDFPDYPFCQFLFDLARFMDGGPKVGTKKLTARSPAMSESRRAFPIPRLSQPGADPQYIHVLKIEG